ncbi:MAG: addiction module protein [Alcanivoracaceae bacterium]|nr:addiction module protein [Alcanivoracaceae bacterium]
MNIENIIDEALHLKPQERYLLIENLICSLNEPNERIDEIWIEEAKKRLKAYQQGKLKTVTYEHVFGS